VLVEVDPQLVGDPYGQVRELVRVLYGAEPALLEAARGRSGVLRASRTPAQALLPSRRVL
jgi:hypothetical protein